MCETTSEVFQFDVTQAFMQSELERDVRIQAITRQVRSSITDDHTLLVHSYADRREQGESGTRHLTESPLIKKIF